MEAALAQLPVSPLEGVKRWRFTPTAVIFFDEERTENHVGELKWDDDHMEIDIAMQARDWCFFMGRTSGTFVWMLFGMHENSCYLFDGLGGGKVADLRLDFLSGVVSRFWRILYPEIPAGDHELLIGPKPTPEEQAQMMRFALAGGLEESPSNAPKASTS
jgi:hypothetical protein